jgi:hypothetical protein
LRIGGFLFSWFKPIPGNVDSHARIISEKEKAGDEFPALLCRAARVPIGLNELRMGASGPAFGTWDLCLDPIHSHPGVSPNVPLNRLAQFEPGL